MRSTRVIHTVSAHAEGEVGDVIVGGVAPPPGETLWAQNRWIAQDDGLRQFMLNEPRGGVFRHVNLLVPPTDPKADAAFIVMEPEDTPPMSGSNSICVSTVLLETGLIPMTEPETRFTLQAPGGLVPVRARCHAGKAEAITVQNLPSFAGEIGTALTVPELGQITVDTAFGGDSFVVVNADDIGLELAPRTADQISALGRAITRAANDQIGFQHPELKDWAHISFCLFVGGLSQGTDGLTARTAVTIRPGKIDRSPCGTGVSALMALLQAKGEMANGETLTARSLINSRFTGRIAGLTNVGQRTAIVPEITGRAWITGTHQHMLDPSDPWPQGYRLSDTWPNWTT